MGIEETLHREAHDMAIAAQHNVVTFEQEVAGLEKRLAETQAKRDAARFATQRLANYRVSLGTDYQCPACWIEHERTVPLRSIPSRTHDDIFRCRNCLRGSVVTSNRDEERADIRFSHGAN